MAVGGGSVSCTGRGSPSATAIPLQREEPNTVTRAAFGRCLRTLNGWVFSLSAYFHATSSIKSVKPDWGRPPAYRQRNFAPSVRGDGSQEPRIKHRLARPRAAHVEHRLTALLRPLARTSVARSAKTWYRSSARDPKTLWNPMAESICSTKSPISPAISWGSQLAASQPNLHLSMQDMLVSADKGAAVFHVPPICFWRQPLPHYSNRDLVSCKQMLTNIGYLGDPRAKPRHAGHLGDILWIF